MSPRRNAQWTRQLQYELVFLLFFVGVCLGWCCGGFFFVWLGFWGGGWVGGLVGVSPPKKKTYLFTHRVGPPPGCYNPSIAGFRGL